MLMLLLSEGDERKKKHTLPRRPNSLRAAEYCHTVKRACILLAGFGVPMHKNIQKKLPVGNGQFFFKIFLILAPLICRRRKKYDHARQVRPKVSLLIWLASIHFPCRPNSVDGPSCYHNHKRSDLTHNLRVRSYQPEAI